MMKQSEKLDFILNKLYEHRNESPYYSIPGLAWDITDEGPDFQKLDELHRLSKRLEKDNMIKTIWDRSGANARITSHGIDYCENSSYTTKGFPLIQNNSITISDSSNVNIISNSHNASINNTSHKEARELINSILLAIKNDTSLDIEFKNEVIECFDEINNKLESNKPVPKLFNTILLDYGSKIASISNFVLNLGKILFSNSQ